jgi:hypothetical protein
MLKIALQEHASVEQHVEQPRSVPCQLIGAHLYRSITISRELPSQCPSIEGIAPIPVRFDEPVEFTPVLK